MLHVDFNRPTKATATSEYGSAHVPSFVTVKVSGADCQGSLNIFLSTIEEGELLLQAVDEAVSLLYKLKG